MTPYLSLEDLLTLVGDLGVGPVYDIGLLDAAAHRPQVELYGEQAYPGLDTKGAVLLDSIARNHALVDGDKRLGWLAAVVFSGLNDVTLEAPDDDVYEFAPSTEGEGPMSALLKPVLAIIAAAALTAGACACGRADTPSGASTTASPATAASATPTVSATPTGTGAPSLDEMYANTAAAVEDADSVVMTRVGKSEEGTLTAELRGTLDGTNVKRTMHESDGAVSTTLVVGDRTFVKANKAFWRGRVSGIDPAALVGIWVTFRGKTPEAHTFPTMRTLIGEDWATGRPALSVTRCRRSWCRAARATTGTRRSPAATATSSSSTPRPGCR